MKVVIDTNVLAIADGQHQNVDPECVINCVSRLLDLQANGCVVIDDNYRIIKEYQRNVDANRGKKMGAAFVKWLRQNQKNPRLVERVTITETSENQFSEFPGKELEAKFDPPDRKFVAVANAHPNRPPILQAADSKWLRWRAELLEHGIRVEFVCPADVIRFYRKKFPDQVVPDII